MKARKKIKDTMKKCRFNKTHLFKIEKTNDKFKERKQGKSNEKR